MYIDSRHARFILEMASELELDTTAGLPSNHTRLVMEIFTEFPELKDEFELLYREAQNVGTIQD